MRNYGLGGLLDADEWDDALVGRVLRFMTQTRPGLWVRFLEICGSGTDEEAATFLLGVRADMESRGG